MDRRRSDRYQTRFDVLFSADGREGAGLLSEISYAGARVEEANLLPAVGAKIRLYVFVQPVAPFEVEAHVTRHTEKGFAVTFELFDEEIRRLVDDVNAFVS